MSLRVAIGWWRSSEPPGGASQAIRGNVKAFRDAGHDVTLYYDNQMALLESHLDRYDLVLTPYLWADQYRNLSAFAEADARFVLQIGGFGNMDRDVRLLARTIAAADLVTVLDPSPALHYNEQVDLPLDEVLVIPNAPNLDVFDPQPVEATEGFVLSPKVGAFHKTGALLAGTAQSTPAITYEAHVKRPRDYGEATGFQNPGNVHLKPPVPFSAMPSRYRDAVMVFNAAERETLPNVCFEAMMSERAYVAYREAVAMIQTIPDLDPGDFGANVEWFMDEYQSRFYAGDHLYLVPDPDTLPEAVRGLYTAEEERWAIAARGREWVAALGREYDWARKAELIVDAARE